MNHFQKQYRFSPWEILFYFLASLFQLQLVETLIKTHHKSTRPSVCVCVLESVTIISRTRSWREDGVYTFLSCQTAVNNFDVRKLNKFEPKFEHRLNFSDLEAEKRAKAEETFNAERSNINIFQPLSKIRQGMGVGCHNLIPRYPVHHQSLGPLDCPDVTLVFHINVSLLYMLFPDHCLNATCYNISYTLHK